MFENLNDENFLLYAAKYYDNPQCETIEEFNNDLKRINYIKKLFNKYKTTGDLKERLIINHLIVLYNVFGVEGATKILFFKLEEYSFYLKPFLVFLNYMPSYIDGIGENGRLVSSNIPMDDTIIQRLRKI